MKISVVGSGSYGTAFASILAGDARHTVTLFSRSESQAEQINVHSKNPQYLDNFSLSSRLRATLDAEELRDSDFIFLALPSGALQSFIDNNVDLLSTCGLVVNLAKGFISSEKTTVPEYLRKKLGAGVRIGALKGPTFAAEMLHAPISAVTISACSSESLIALKALLRGSNIKFDVISNIETLEFLSILKNVYAIAIGIVEAKFKSPNVRAAIFTECAIEMQLVCSLCTSERVDILKYAGIGDLLLTSLNDQSRNRTLGLMIGKGFISPTAYDKAIVVEGLRSVSFVTSKLTLADQSRALVISTLSRLINSEISVGDFITTVLHQETDPQVAV